MPSAAMLDHLASNVSFVVPIWKMTSTAGTVAAYAAHTRDLIFGGVTYSAAQVEPTRFSQTLGVQSANNIELFGIFDSIVNEADLQGGKWKNAKIQFEYVAYDPATGGYNSAMAGPGLTWTGISGATESPVGFLDKTAADGWGNCGAVSVETKTGDCRLTIYCDDYTQNYFVGLDPSSSCNNYNTVDFGVFFNASTDRVIYENGTGHGGFPISGSDPIMVVIERVGTNFDYYYKHYTGSRPAPDDAGRIHFRGPIAGTSSPLYVNMAMYWNAIGFCDATKLLWVSNGGSVGKIRGQAGKFSINNGTFTVELRSLSDLLQQEIGDLTSPLDRNRSPEALGVSMGPFTFARTVTAVADKRNFTVGGTAQVNDYFKYGRAEWSTGANAGLKMEIKASVGNVIELQLPMRATIVNGDTLNLIAGYDSTRQQARDKFAAMENFDGEPDLPGLTKGILQYPE